MHVSARERRRQADRRGFLILAASAVAVAGGVGVMFATRPQARRPDTDCVHGAVAARQTIVIVDRTDPWNENQQSLLHAAIAAIARSVAVNDRLSLIAFDGTPERPPTPLFDRCSAGDGSTVGNLISNSDMTEENYQVNFAQPLAAALSVITKPSHAKDTHLAAFLANVAAHARYDRHARAVRIVVFSDLAENSPGFSFYGTGKKHAAAQNFAHHFGALIADRLDGMTLDVYLLPLAGGPDSTRHIKETWSAALSQHGIAYSIKDL